MHLIMLAQATNLQQKSSRNGKIQIARCRPKYKIAKLKSIAINYRVFLFFLYLCWDKDYQRKSLWAKALAQYWRWERVSSSMEILAFSLFKLVFNRNFSLILWAFWCCKKFISTRKLSSAKFWALKIKIQKIFVS